MNDSNNHNTELNTADVYLDDIDYYFHEYLESRNIDDEYNMRPQQWTAALQYIYNHTFKIDNSILRPKHIKDYSYNMNAVSNLLDRYILWKSFRSYGKRNV